jgi:hypothetical protein
MSDPDPDAYAVPDAEPDVEPDAEWIMNEIWMRNRK